MGRQEQDAIQLEGAESWWTYLYGTSLYYVHVHVKMHML